MPHRHSSVVLAAARTSVPMKFSNVGGISHSLEIYLLNFPRSPRLEQAQGSGKLAVGRLPAGDQDKQPGASKIPLHTPAQQRQELQKAVKAIIDGSHSTLKTIRKGYLLALAQLNAVSLPGTSFVKSDIVDALVKWVR